MSDVERHVSDRTHGPRRRSRLPIGLIAGATLLQMATTPGQTIGLSVLVDPMIERLGTSRSSVTAAYLVGTLLGSLALGPTGRMLDRHGVRKVAAVAGVLLGVFIASMAGVTGLAGLTIAFVGTRALGQGALTLAASTAVVVGFDRRRGVAIGLTSALGGAAMALVPLGVVALLSVTTVGVTWLVLAGASTMLVLIVAASPLLDRRDHDVVARSSAGQIRHPVSWSRAEALRTPAFGVVTAAVALSALVGTALAFHHIDLLTSRGLTPAAAAINFLPQTLAAAGGAIVAGRLADRARPQVLLSACLVGLAAASALPLVIAPGWSVLLYGLVIGSSSAAIRSVETAALARWFGTAHIGEIRGLVMTVAVAASALGPLLFAWSLERSGSYASALMVAAACSLLLAVGSAGITTPRRNDAGTPQVVSVD